MESDVIDGARKKSAGGKGKKKTGDDRGRKIFAKPNRRARSEIGRVT